jgi:modulator of FtsH protease
MDPSTLTAWSYYFSAIASADATLTGLIFVAVSINLTKILATPGLTGRVAEPMIQLFGVLAISTTCLIPGLRPHTLGLLILILTIFIWAFQVFTQAIYIAAKTGNPRYWLVTRVLQTQVACIPLFVSGALLLHGVSSGLYWAAAGFVLALAAGVESAWVLLIEILR